MPGFFATLSAKLFTIKPARFLFFSFVSILLPSTLLLMTKAASVTGLNWIDALYTATSALTVTGFSVVDTGTHFTLLGQLLLVLLMQLGGLGQMSMTVLFLTLLRQKIGLRQQALLNEELNHARPINLLHLIRRVVVFALSVQLVGAMILAIKWVPEFGWFTGLHYSIFHAISAFNNAGFTLFSNSLTGYVDSELVNFAIIGLIILGGLGFTVVLDVVSYRGRRRLELHSQLVIITSVILLVGGTVAIYLLEMNNSGSIAGIESTDGKILAAFFQSATARTAGFNTIDIVSMSPASLFFIMGLMFIGAGSTSTGGGIKVSTFAVALIGTRTFLRGQKEFNVLSRRIPPTTVLRSLAIIVVSFFLLITAIFALLLTEEASYPLVMFETLSAFSTVGLSAGLTERLSDPGKLIMVMVMIIGRVGPLTMAYLLASNQQTHLRFSEEDVITG